MPETFTKNLREVIKSEILNTKYDIYVAVAWFTDYTLFSTLIELAKRGVEVKITLFRDAINQNAKFDHRDIEKFGGSFFSSFHHHKFCVIDRKVVLTGSCNWTNRGLRGLGDENLVKIESREEGEKYAEVFNRLKSNNTVPNNETDLSDYYGLEFMGSFKRVVDLFINDGWEFAKPRGESFEDLWKKITSFPVLLLNSENREFKIRIEITNELREILEKERKNIPYLPIYSIVHKNGSLWNFAIVLGLEENNGQRFDPVSIL